MTRCPVCKNEMFIIESDDNDTYTFEGEVLHYNKFFQCPRCNIYGAKNNDLNGKRWELGMQRLKMNGKWYFFWARWKPLKPLSDFENDILKTQLNTLEKLSIQLELKNHLTKEPFIFR